MAILKSEAKKIAIIMPTSFLTELDQHLKNYALIDRSQWLLDAARERMAKEKQFLRELQENKEE
jgi:metal-responsive CopG/Arc/MetJ family transcriptional regulator